MDDDERALLEDYVGRMHDLEISVVAAAGNGGGPLELPGNVQGVIPVAAGEHG